jgi:hypothetical protein
MPQSVDSLAIDPTTVSCNAQNNGQAQSLDKNFNVIGFQLPQSDAQWSLICTRKPVVDSIGNRNYGPVDLILTTSAGALPISLPQIGYAAGAWVSELRSDTTTLAKKLSSMEVTMAGQKIIAQCSGDDFFPDLRHRLAFWLQRQWSIHSLSTGWSTWIWRALPHLPRKPVAHDFMHSRG